MVNAYTLVFGGFLLLGGRAGDLLGRKRVFLAGVVLFSLASLLCALADTDTQLIVARAIQGLGAAFISPAALSIITTTFTEGPQRTRAMGVWAVIAIGGAAVGLVMGGILVTVLSWEWVFFVNVPVGALAFVLSLLFVPESEDRAHHRSFDLAGALTVTAGLSVFVLGIVRSHSAGWGSPQVLGLLAGGVALLVAFVAIERRSVEPLMRLDIFHVRTLRAANVAMFVLAAGLFATFFFNTLYLQRVLGFSPLEAGLAFLPFTAGVIFGSSLSQVLIPRLGAREVPVLGMVLATIGMLLLLRLEPDGSYLRDFLPAIVCTAVGMGLVFVPVTLIATSGVPHADAGLASGLFNTSQQVGGSIGLAFLATLASGRTGEELDALGPDASPDDKAIALVDGFHLAYGVGAGLLLAAAAALLLLLRRRDVVAVSHGHPPRQGA